MEINGGNKPDTLQMQIWIMQRFVIVNRAVVLVLTLLTLFVNRL